MEILHKCFEGFKQFVKTDTGQAIAWACTVFGVGILAVVTGILKKLFPSKSPQIAEQKQDNSSYTKDDGKSSCILSVTVPEADELIGRDSDITAVKNLLSQHSIVSIHADGGVGKTAVALRIINDTENEIERGASAFKHVAWIRSTGSVRNDLSKLDIPGIEVADSVNAKFIVVKNFLENNPTLLVIDNMVSPLSAGDISDLNTVSGNTKILITSRIEIECSKGYPLNILDKQDAVKLFYKHYLKVSNVSETDDRTDKVYVEKIVESASGNALLIELIAKMAYWEYTDRLYVLWENLETNVFGTDSEADLPNAHADSHLQEALSEDDLKLQGQIRNLYLMSGLDETKQELMRFIAAFPTEEIIFSDAFKWAGFKIPDLQYLTDRGWIEKDGEGYLIHTIVQGSVRLQKPDFDIEKYKNLIKALSNTEQYMPEDMVYTKVRERIVVPDTVCRLLMEAESQKEETATLYNNIAGVYQDQGNFEKALEYYGKALAIVREVLGEDHSYTADTYNNIAMVYVERGDYKKAQEYYKKALLILKKVPGESHIDLATTYNNIGTMYQSQGDNIKALDYFERALVIKEKEQGKEHPDTATTYNNIAVVYESRGDFDKALTYFGKALIVNEKEQGKNHPDTATAYNNIAGVYKEQGDYAKALEYYKKALVIIEKVLGPEHPNTATKYNNIAGVYHARGDYTNALKYHKKALVIIEKALGPEHPNTAATYNNIGTVYRDLGDYTNALDNFKKALAIIEKVRGEDHLDTAVTYNNIGTMYQDLGNYTTALDYYKKYFEIVRKVQGKNHPDTATAYNNIAGVYKEQGDYAKALEYYKKALVVIEKVLGPEHPNTAATYNNIAGVYEEQGDYTKALEYYKRALKIALKVLGPVHSDIATSYHNIADVYKAQGNYAKALENYENSILIKEKTLGLDHPSLAITYNNIAIVYQLQDDCNKAMDYYAKALAINQKVFGIEHPETAKIYNNIGMLCYYLHYYTEAQRCLQTAYDVFLKALGKDHPYTKDTKEALEIVSQKLDK